MIEARDAADALTNISAYGGRIDLVLTDVIMPEKSGAELLTEAKQLYPNICALFMSGYTGDVVARHGVSMQEAFFLEKPFTKRALLKKVYPALHRDMANSE